jgi:transposase
VHKATQREAEAIEKPLFPLHAQRFPRPAGAHDALTALAKRWRSHRVASSPLSAHTRSAGQGRPTPRTPLKVIAWPLQAQVRPDDEALGHSKHVKACCVLGTNIGPRAWSDTAVIAAYTGQSRGEGGLRFLTDPLVFVASLLVKKPSRIAGLLMVMPRALLVYSVAPRRLRQQ